MDRAELIAHIEGQIAHIGANVPAAQGGSAAVRSLGAIVSALKKPGVEGAVGAAERLVRDVEEMGGIARGHERGAAERAGGYRLRQRGGQGQSPVRAPAA